MAAHIDMPTSYAAASRMLRDRGTKRIGHNTKLVRHGIIDGSNRIDVVYHRTSIVQLYEDGRVVLDNGGFYTRTTKDRLSTAMYALGIGGLTQRKGSWYFRFDSGPELPYVNRQTFYTGVVRRGAAIAAARKEA